MDEHIVNIRRNHLQDIFRMRNYPRMKQDEDERKGGGVVLPHRFERVQTSNDNIISYMPDRMNRVGVYVGPSPLCQAKPYFEIEILDQGMRRSIAVGLVPYHYPLNAQPGWKAHSVAYHADDGRLYKSAGHGTPFGPQCHTGDRIGCGIHFAQSHDHYAIVFFTRNGNEVGKCKVKVPPGGLHPGVGMHSEGEEVQLHLDADYVSEDAMLMAVDHCEEDWRRLHDVRVCGQALEYTGRGKTIHDVGLAQACSPLTTTNHYYEIEILDPGENCYIAIGLAKKNYPKGRHPGWNKDSIAYHADDGKLFSGSGVGDPFGPRCYKGDRMGCGIFFPPDYEELLLKGDDWREEEDDDDDPVNNDSPDSNHKYSDDDDDNDDYEFPLYDEDNEDEEDYPEYDRQHPPPLDDKALGVEVFFTRNGKMIGKRRTAIPKGGFYPTVGMLSSCERVQVDLHPVTG